MIAPENPTQTEAGAQASADTATAQVDRAHVNQGDTVRASWRFSLDAVRTNIAYMSEDARDLLVWSFNWCIDPVHPIRFQDFCERIGYSDSVVYKAYSGKLRHPTLKDASQKPSLMDISKDMLKALRDFRRVEIQRAKLGRKQFVLTPTAKKIFTYCDLARESQTPVFIFGGSHIGKTEAAKQYCIENNHGKSRLIELEAINGLHGLIKATAAVLGVSPNGNAADLTERIKRAISPDMVLIFDEVHLLANTYRRGSFFACMEWIRRLYDFRQFGLVLTFTELGFKKAEAERRKELEQLFRRGVHRLNLGPEPLTLDVEVFLGAWGLEMPARKDSIEVKFGRVTITEEPFNMLRQLASEDGIKAITERLRYAGKFAADRDDSGEITWDDVVRAHLTIIKAAQAPVTGWDKAKEIV